MLYVVREKYQKNDNYLEGIKLKSFWLFQNTPALLFQIIVSFKNIKWVYIFLWLDCGLCRMIFF